MGQNSIKPHPAPEKIKKEIKNNDFVHVFPKVDDVNNEDLHYLSPYIYNITTRLMDTLSQDRKADSLYFDKLLERNPNLNDNDKHILTTIKAKISPTTTLSTDDFVIIDNKLYVKGYHVTGLREAWISKWYGNNADQQWKFFINMVLFLDQLYGRESDQKTKELGQQTLLKSIEKSNNKRSNRKDDIVNMILNKWEKTYQRLQEIQEIFFHEKGLSLNFWSVPRPTLIPLITKEKNLTAHYRLHSDLKGIIEATDEIPLNTATFDTLPFF